MLPYVLFAYHEVPQESTRFSPSELLYGRDVRGPLDVLQEEWIGMEKSPDDVITYKEKVQNQLETVMEAVKDSMEKVQGR